jgi:hypothetical protein
VLPVSPVPCWLGVPGEPPVVPVLGEPPVVPAPVVPLVPPVPDVPLEQRPSTTSSQRDCGMHPQSWAVC